MRFRTLKLLLWKNYRWRRHFWIWTLIEALVPIIIAIYMPYAVLFRSNSWGKSNVFKHPTWSKPVNDKSFILHKIFSINMIAYSPSNEFNEQLVKNVLNVLDELPTEEKENITKKIEMKNFSSEDDLELFVFDRNVCDSCIGIVFENSRNTFRYKLRLNDFIKTLESPVLKGRPVPNQYDVYLERGFAGIQLLLNEEFIRMQFNKTDWHPPNLQFQGFPVLEYETSNIPNTKFLTIALSSVIITSIALSMPFINAVIQEKESGVKELMKIHGVEEWIIWLSWLIHAFTVPGISLTVMTIIFKAPILTNGVELVRYVTFPVIWLLLMLYTIANISFICLFCAIFHKGVVASFAFIIVLIANFLWIAFYQGLNLQNSWTFVALIPASAFAIAIETVQKHEKFGESFDLTSLRYVSYSICALIFDTFFYSLLTLYVTSINPGTFGIPKSPLFFLEPFFTKTQKTVEPSKLPQYSENTRVTYVEPPSPSPKPFILVKNLIKQYGSLHAIDGIDLAIYENEITVILGHTEAGKTTLLSILAGLNSYEEGYLQCKGEDLKENLDMLRKHSGICFQQDRLFEFLSVMDHLIFYSMLKGLNIDDATSEAIYSMNMMEITEKRKIKANALPLPFKRKLSLAIGLLNKPEILILDEPTLGMDFTSKKIIWNILKNVRKNHIIILSTSYAKEAERLGDRIAIMQSGEIVTYGTRAYLEKTYGTGYELIITLEKNANHAALMSFVKNLITNTLVTREKLDEIVFRIPLEETSKFVPLFKKVEGNKKQLGIVNIEVTYATLEQILLKLQNESFDVPKRLSRVIIDDTTTTPPSSEKNAAFSTSLPSQASKNQMHDPNFQIEKNFSLKVQQMRVLLEVKIWYTKRNYLNALVKHGLPSLILAVALLTAAKFKPRYEINLSLEPLQNPHILLQETGTNSDLYKIYSSYIKESGGVVIPFSENVIDKLIEIGGADRILYGTSLLAAFEFEKNTTKIVYNQWELKSLPIAINIYSNSLMKYEIENTIWKIENMNKPMPDISESQCGKKSEETYRLAIITMLFVFFAFYTIDLVVYFFEFMSMEVAKKLTHMHVLSNMSFWIYWLTIFVFDFIFFITIVILRLTIVLLLSDMNLNFMPLYDFHGTFILMTVLFGISGLLCVYTMSFVFKTTKSVYAICLALNVLCSISMFMFNQIEASVLMNNLHIIDVFYYPMKFIIFLNPFLNFTLVFNKFLEIWKRNSACDSCQPYLKSSCESNLKKSSFLDFPSSTNPNGLSFGLLSLFTNIILYAILLSLINMGYLDHWSNLLSSYFIQHTNSDQEDDYGIKQERIDIQNIKKDPSKYNEVSLLADGLSRNYFKSLKPNTAVENISFIAQRGTCFGILGVNGSGKSSILKMLAAEISPTKGNISIEGVKLNTKKHEYISKIGYCPQIDPLIDEFTGKEMLKLFGLLNGIKRNDIDMIVNEWISTFGFENMQDKICKRYNHSTKRRLSTAISLIGNPKVIILDEPTTGTDSDTKYKFQQIMIRSKELGKTVVLGSVSLDECQKLCDRITIIMNGEMHCIGTVESLKKRFAVGFSVTIRIRREIVSSRDIILLEQNFINVFNQKYCYLKEELKDLLYYHIKDPLLTWSALFEKMETIKQNNNIIESYILKNISLKEIFTSFSKPERTSSRNTFQNDSV